MENKYTFHVHGMHCSACTLLIESELNNLPGVIHAKANLSSHTLEVLGRFDGRSVEQIAELLTIPVKDNGYTVSVEKPAPRRNFGDFKFALPIALGFLALFLLLQKVGLINLIGGQDVGLTTAFLIGVVASLSSCMAVVGGLLLSMSATFAKGGEKTKPQILFHLGRLVAFFILGGAIGAIGSAFTLGSTGTFITGIVIGLVMLILGINLLDIFDWTKKLQPRMPKFLSRRAHNISKMSHSLTPLLVGVATFFLPCGFTQSMQLYTLTSGSFWNGALTMFTFALGTLPILALVSFSQATIKNSTKSGIFFKTAGLVVIAFALFNIINSLAVAGIIRPVFSF